MQIYNTDTLCTGKNMHNHIGNFFVQHLHVVIQVSAFPGVSYASVNLYKL